MSLLKRITKLTNHFGSHDVDEDQFRKEWPRIHTVTDNLINQQQISKDEWDDSFFDVYKLCSWDEQGASKLIKVLSKRLNDMLKVGFASRLASIKDSNHILSEYSRFWQKYDNLCHNFLLAFQQLDLATKNVILHGNSHQQAPTSNNCFDRREKFKLRGLGESTVRIMMLKLWNDIIVEPSIDKLLPSAIELIRSERLGIILESKIITNLIESLMSLDDLRLNQFNVDYMKRFEAMYLEELRTFYTNHSIDCLQKLDSSAYIKWASEMILREERNSKLYLYLECRRNSIVTKTCTETLVKNFLDLAIVRNDSLVSEQESPTTRLVFEFLDKVNGYADVLFLKLQKYFESTCLKYLAQDKCFSWTNCQESVEKLLKFYDQFELVVAENYNNDPRARNVLQKAFQTIVNDTSVFEQQQQIQHNRQLIESRWPELMAGYCDLLLRRSVLSKRQTLDEISLRLKRMSRLINCLKHKEHFFRCHKSQLTKRLVLNRTLGCELEEDFVMSLRELKGSQYEELSGFFRMFKDFKFSKNFQAQFWDSIANGPKPAAEQQVRFDFACEYHKSASPSTSSSANNNLGPCNPLHHHNNNNNINNNSVSATMTAELIATNNNRPNIEQELNSLQIGSSLTESSDSIDVKILNPSAWSMTNSASGLVHTSSPSSCSYASTQVRAQNCAGPQSATAAAAATKSVHLPAQLRSLLNSIELFYKSHKEFSEKRRLIWSEHLSHGIISLTCASGVYDIELTAAQLSVLSCLLDSQAGLAFGTIEAETRLAAADLKRILWMLTCSPKHKVQLLQCEPSLCGFQNTDHEANKFSFNEKFAVIGKDGKCLAKGRTSLIGKLQI